MCTCEKCTCNLGGMLEKKMEEEKVHTFLMGLDEIVYGTVRSNILAQDSLSNINKVYSTSHSKRAGQDDLLQKRRMGEIMALTARSRSYEREKTMVCSYCKIMEHEFAKLFHSDRISRVMGRSTQD